MNPHRTPIREIRRKYKKELDRFAAVHEQRCQKDHDIRNEETSGVVTLHAAPASAVTTDAPSLLPHELTNAKLRLWPIRGDRGVRPTIKTECVEYRFSTDRGREGGERLALFDNGLFELVTTRAVQTKRSSQQTYPYIIGNAVAQNVLRLLVILDELDRSEDVLATATYTGFDGVEIRSEYDRVVIEDEDIQTDVVSFSPLDPDAREYTDHVEPVSRLLQPLWYAGERAPWDMDLDEVLNVPEIDLE